MSDRSLTGMPRLSSFSDIFEDVKRKLSDGKMIVESKPVILKKARTGYNFFCMKHYDEAKEAFDKYGLSVAESLKTMWENADQSEKNIYNNMSKNEKRRINNGESIYINQSQSQYIVKTRKKCKSFENRDRSLPSYFDEEERPQSKWKKFKKKFKKVMKFIRR